MELTTRRTRRRPSVRPTVEVLQLLPRPHRPATRPSPAPASPSAAAPPPELDQQLCAIAGELARWWI